jgi:hypothetical protein
MDVIHVRIDGSQEAPVAGSTKLDREESHMGGSPSRFSGASWKEELYQEEYWWTAEGIGGIMVEEFTIRGFTRRVRGRGRRHAKRMQPWKPRGSGRDDTTTPLWWFHEVVPTWKVPLGRGCFAQHADLIPWQMKPWASGM